MKIERKYLAHYIDASFGAEATNYVRLGKDLEEFNDELNPDVETKKNIIGEQSVNHKGYDVQTSVDTFYADKDDPLSEQLEKIVNERRNGDACCTTRVDLLLNEDGSVVWAYREDVVIVPTSFGGDTSGVQIPFTIYNNGNRVKGTWDVKTKKFTPGAAEASA